MSDDWDRIEKKDRGDFYEYFAPEGFHFESKDGVNYGCVVFDEDMTDTRFLSRYRLVKDTPIR